MIHILDTDVKNNLQGVIEYLKEENTPSGRTCHPSVRGERGAVALLAVVGLSVAILVIVLGLMDSGFTENIITTSSFESQKSFYLSEPGTEDALIKIARNKDFASSSPSEWNPAITGSGENLDVSVSGSSTKTIYSTSTIKDRYSNIKMEVSVDADGKITTSTWQETE